MLLLIRYITFVLLGCLPLHLAAQNTIGIPNVFNYSKQLYSAGSQNWNIAQDKQGIMYFANNDGLLSFDGTFWRLYKLPNKTIVRSVNISKDGRIYVGGQGEIGYFIAAKNGELEYHSLNKLIPVADNDFADVWNICFFNNKVFFRSNRKIFEYDQSKIHVHASPNWGFMAAVNGELIAYENDRGLVSFHNDNWFRRINIGQLPTENFMLRSALHIGTDSVLLVSLMHGLFILHRDSLSPFSTPDLLKVADKNISSACMLSPDRIALTTNLAGCVIIDKKGKFIQRFTKREGIQNNNVLTAMMDKDQNLWLGLDNGIDLVTYNNAIRNIFPDKDDRNSGYTSVIHRNQLFLGVSTGLYRIPIDTQSTDLSYNIGEFDFVEESKGQVWNLSSLNGRLFMGHNKGAYQVEENKAIPIDTKTGAWGFQPLYAGYNSPTLIAGTYSGINFYKYANGTLSGPEANTQVESARFVAIGKDQIWIAHPYKGVYYINYDRNGVRESARYKDTKGILSTNHNKIFKVGNRIILTSDNGLFEYDENERDFIRSARYEKMLGKKPVSFIKEDQYGNTWFSRDRRIGVVEPDSENRITFIPEINDRIMANGFEHINVIDSNNVLIAAEKGFFHINYALYKKKKQPLSVLIRKADLTLKPGGLLFGGYLVQTTTPSISYKYNSIHFECSSVTYGQHHNTEYSYLLEGFDKTWSEWSSKTEKDYTNLPAGNYVFRVKCRNNIDNESPESSFSFTILPPWYQTWWAYLLYFGLAGLLIYAFYKRQQHKYKRLQQVKLLEQQRKYDEEQKQLELQHQLAIRENEKEIIQLKNENLQAEVTHKNAELASSAMNLVRKKEILSGLKDDLVRYKDIPENERASKEFLKIIRAIDRELDHNEEWEQFAIHFDSVHNHYLKKLKDAYPSLTTSDLKLAAYLRLNLSTKEIAQLMNISVRGVETSRYRLRKKLGLANEVNLYDFLLSATT